MDNIDINNALGLDIRKTVLAASLTIESVSSFFIGQLLGIKDIENSKLLGNKSGCFSFNQKVDLLIELGALSKDDKKKFQAFMEIRNQFMHNIEAINYEKCISFIENADNKLLKLFPQASNLTKEEQLKKATLALSKEVLRKTTDVTIYVKKKLQKDYDAEMAPKLLSLFTKNTVQMKGLIISLIENEYKQNTNLNKPQLKELGDKLIKTITDQMISNFNQLFTK